MKREIKFRAWDGKNNIMKYQPIAMCNIGGNINTVFSGDYPNYVWMQFTGLHDKNGKEIYEGDVVRDFTKKHYTVEYNDFCAFMLYSINNRYIFLAIYPGIELEVIGNIYENPDLLEATK